MIAHNWLDILKRAWSVRFIVIAWALSVAEAILPLYMDTIPRGLFSLLTSVTVAAAFIARFVAQQGL